MKESEKGIHPPRWAERFLCWYCKPELLEDLQGDLNEYFERNIKSKGVRKAKLIYIVDVIKFLRIYTLRKPKFIDLLIQWIMIGSYIKTSGRSIVRNKLFSTINIIGLAISMSVGLLLIGLISDIRSYDQFHQNKERIYRVTSNYQYLDHADDTYFASTSPRAGQLLSESFTGVEDAAVMYSGADDDIKTTDDKIIPLKGFWANASFFNVFTFPLMEGHAATALKEPFSLVLTREAAKKLYGTTDVIGKTVTLKEHDDQPYKITGVMEDVPVFSHLQFEMLISFSTRAITQKEYEKEEMSWGNIWQGYVYLLLPENTDLTTLQANIDAMCLRENPTVENTKIKLRLQPLADIAMGKRLNNSPGETLDENVVWVVLALTFIVILSACFNYTNLSIARALKRAKEVGVRKVIGASRGYVISQFLTESVMISLFALVLSFGLFLVLRPYFLSVNPSLETMIRLDLSFKMTVFFVLFAVTVGVLAGIFPALFFSQLQAIRVLKGSFTSGTFKNVNMRKVLIVFQFTVSLAFIAASIISYRQYVHFVNFDLGFNTENVVNVYLQGNKADLLIKELQEMPETQGIAKSRMISGIGNYYGSRLKYKNPQDSIHIQFNAVDENYIPLMGHRLIAGRNFKKITYEENENEVIITESVLPYLNIDTQSPEKALGETVKLNGKEMEVIGVLKNYYYGSAQDDYKKIVFRYIGEKASYLNVKMSSTDWPATLNKIDRAWKKVDPIHPSRVTFYSEQIKERFRDMLSMLKIIGFLAILSICIAAMGLLGMVIFTTETRMREISIRKVMGANNSQLIFLLGKNFMLLLTIAIFIAIPGTYYFFHTVVLVSMRNHAPISLVDLLLGVGSVMGFALFLIGMQTLKAARSNPAEVLKTE
jgi:putative ABC transport system permease protein